jgi:hypothetical protein
MIRLKRQGVFNQFFQMVSWKKFFLFRLFFDFLLVIFEVLIYLIGFIRMVFAFQVLLIRFLENIFLKINYCYIFNHLRHSRKAIHLYLVYSISIFKCLHFKNSY